MILRSHTCSKIAVGLVFLGILLEGCLLPLYGTGQPAIVSGHVELVFSRDPSVRKHQDYSGVVVWLEPVSGSLLPAAKPARVQMIQKDKTFSPHVLPIMVGTTIDFPNYDPIFHNAFSNYNGQIFDIGLYPPGTSKSILFRREGVVRVFCNIHPAMSAVIVVLKSPYFCVSKKSGDVQITGVPLGMYRMHVFHERSTEQTLAALVRTVDISEERFQLPPISVSETGYLQLPHTNKYGKEYPPDSDSVGYPGRKP